MERVRVRSETKQDNQGRASRTMMAPAWALKPLAGFLPGPDVDVINKFPSE